MTLRPSQQRIARTAPPNRVNKARKSKEFVRTYLSVARVQFIQRLHCIVDGCEATQSENAHLYDDGSKGAGRKSGHLTIGPLCREHHGELDDVLGAEKFSEKYGVVLEDEAAKAERLWQRVAAHYSAEFECDVDFNDGDEGC